MSLRSLPGLFLLLTLSLTFAACGDEAVSEEPVAAAHAAVVEDHGPACEAKLGQILPFSSTTCTGEFSVCQADREDWIYRNTTNAIGKTLLRRGPMTPAQRQAECTSSGPFFFNKSYTGIYNGVYERRDDRLLSVSVEMHQAHGDDGLYWFYCVGALERKTYDASRACTQWSLPLSVEPTGRVDVGYKVCTTCDQIDPVASPTDRSKCIAKMLGLNDARLAPERPRLIGQLKYLYERSGRDTEVRPYFVSDPRTVAACGPAPVSEVCTPSIDWKLNLCQRLVSDFARKARGATTVQAAGLSWGLEQCHALLPELAKQPAGTCEPARAAALRIHRELQEALDRDFVAAAVPGASTLSKPQLAGLRFRHFRELETDLTASLVNRAQGKSATQSSVLSVGTAGRAVDGNTDGVFDHGSVMHTQLEDQPYWQVDLGSVVDIHSIEIFNRTDCCSDRLKDLWVFVSDEPITGRYVGNVLTLPKVQFRQAPGVQQALQIVKVGAHGRYVRVQLGGSDYLSMAEVRVNEAVRLVPPTPTAELEALAYLAPMFTKMMDWAHAFLVPAPQSPEGAAVDLYLNGLHGRDLAAARDFLTALYPMGQLPNLGAFGQVSVVAEVLTPLADRVEAFARVHDFGCALGVCPLTAPLDRELSTITKPDFTPALWQLPASNTIPAGERTLVNGWATLLRDFFSQSTNTNTLPNAIARFLPDGATDLAALSPEVVPPPLQRLYRLVARSRSRWELFQATGHLVPAQGKKIHRLTNLANREKMAHDVEVMAQTASNDADTFNAEFEGMVSGILSNVASEAQLVGLHAEYDRLNDDLKTRNLQIIAHRKAILDDHSFDERVRAMTEEVGPDFTGELANEFVGRPDAKLLKIDASNVTFSSKQDPISNYAIYTSPALAKGKLYQINTGGSWSPTCGLRKMKDDLVAAKSDDGGGFWDDPIGTVAGWTKDAIDWPLDHAGLWSQISKIEPVELDLSNAVTGPEGFTLALSQGKYSVESNSKNVTPGYFGVSQGFSEQSGTSNRVDATFVSGLRFPESMLRLPVNDAPVGSLLAVEMPEGETKIGKALNVYVVQGPSTTLPVSKDNARFVLVANDNCSIFTHPELNTSVNLTVNSFVVTGGDQLLGSFLAAVAEMTTAFRAETPAYVARGELLLSDVSVLENEAFLKFKAALHAHSPELENLQFSQLPEAFQHLYSVFVQREINRIDRVVRISQLDREVRSIEMGLSALADQVSKYESMSTISDRMREWNLARLDMYAQSQDVDQALSYLRDYLLPVFQLWYPGAITGLRSISEVTVFAQLTPFTSALVYSSKISKALEKVAAAYRLQANFRYNNISNPMMVVLSIPDPEAACPGGESGPPPGGPPPGDSSPGGSSAPCSPPVLADGRPIDAAQAKAFWDALRAARDGHPESAKFELHVDPSMLYSRTVGPYRLICEAALPVVTRVAFMPITSSEEGLPPTNKYTWAINFGGSQTYVNSQGAQEFSLLETLADLTNRLLTTNLIFARTTDFSSRFLAANHVATASGISPFTTYSLDFGKYGPELLAELLPVKQFLLVLELEAVSDQVANVPVCAP